MKARAGLVLVMLNITHVSKSFDSSLLLLHYCGEEKCWRAL